MKKDFYAVILGSDENAYGTARLFRDAYGIRPLILCERPLIPTRYSRLFDLEQIERFGAEEVFAPALEARLKKIREQYDKIVVVPCSDYYAGLLARIPEITGRYIANRFPSAELMETLDTKDKFYRLCEEHGLPYPKTYVCPPERRLTLAQDIDFPFPIIVKPENSNAYDYLHCTFEGKKKVYRFDTPEGCRRVMEAMNGSGYRGKLIAQEFIPGGDDAMRVMNAYCSPEGKVLAMSLGQPVLEEYAPKTLGNYAAIISRSDAALYDRVKTFLEEIGYVGFANLDMKFDSRTGTYQMFEINPRLGRSSYYVSGTGINMMEVMTENCVYGKTFPVRLGSDVRLWYNVPRWVLTTYVKDEALKKEIGTLLKEKKAFRTLVCPGDGDLRRRYWIWRYFHGQGKNFKRYFYQK